VARFQLELAAAPSMHSVNELALGTKSKIILHLKEKFCSYSIDTDTIIYRLGQIATFYDEEFKSVLRH
jgi:hypothetical protein